MHRGDREARRRQADRVDGARRQRVERHSRPAQGGRLHLSLGLAGRRPADLDEDQVRAALVGALSDGAQRRRQPRLARPHGARVRRHDRRPVRGAAGAVGAPAPRLRAVAARLHRRPAVPVAAAPAGHQALRRAQAARPDLVHPRVRHRPALLLARARHRPGQHGSGLIRQGGRRGDQEVTTQLFAPGGYRFILAVFQYSGGVVAEPGFRIERVTFREPVPLAQGFHRVEAIVAARGRPPTAFCACELRSPLPFTDEGFRAFNEHYVETLARWGIYDGNTNPVARSNVCPEIAPPAEPSLHAFSFTVPVEPATSTFVVAGSGEAREGGAVYRERTVRYGETSPEAMREKAVFVLGEMERRLRLLGQSWSSTTATQVYTVHDLHPSSPMRSSA